MKLEYYTKGPNRVVVRSVGELSRIHSALDFHFKDEALLFLEYYSARLGIVKVNFQTKEISGNVWETSEAAQSASNINYHYTGFLLQGQLTATAKEAILSSVLFDIQDPNLEFMIEKRESKARILTHIQSKYTFTEHP
ncbi:hypothetical protein LPTSP4_34210 [Leptospira ryugenii]|uniref:Uncharacterized protein n=1 Tax=Leptospira ryugenii TaxID=1917863 RepID=A0A2P2E4S9_9LEPT|nr:hypothetical protein [Leptospira ryugenii]GBF51883.1 hypothetical protein LPTSP4_34210 [Leptospira ryugenii]